MISQFMNFLVPKICFLQSLSQIRGQVRFGLVYLVRLTQVRLDYLQVHTTFLILLQAPKCQFTGLYKELCVRIEAYTINRYQFGLFYSNVTFLCRENLINCNRNVRRLIQEGYHAFKISILAGKACKQIHTTFLILLGQIKLGQVRLRYVRLGQVRLG